jgi:hypothetical protein
MALDNSDSVLMARHAIDPYRNSTVDAIYYVGFYSYD